MVLFTLQIFPNISEVDINSVFWNTTPQFFYYTFIFGYLLQIVINLFFTIIFFVYQLQKFV